MGRQQERIEEPPADTQGWMITFSDCMTLLLTFFVLLLSFSSFDEAARGQFAGAFRVFSQRSIFDSLDRTSILEETPTEIDRTEDGSEKPVDHDLEALRNPRQVDAIADDAQASRQVLRLASEARRHGYLSGEGLFLGSGSVLTDDGRRRLDLVAEFLLRLPCRVTVGESRLAWADSAGEELSIRRCEAVVAHLVSRGVSPEEFSLAAASGQAAARAGGAVIEITLLARGMYE